MDQIQSIKDVLLSALSEPYHDGDPIKQCGAAPLMVIRTRPKDVQRLAHERLHAFPFKDVPVCWRRLYCEASLWMAVKILLGVMDGRSHYGNGEKEQGDMNGLCLKRLEVSNNIRKDWLTDLVEVLDMALILTGAPLRARLIDDILSRLSSVLESERSEPLSLDSSEEESQPRATKRQRLDSNDGSQSSLSIPLDPNSHPVLRHPIPRASNLSLPAFQTHLNTSHIQNNRNGPLPLIITSSLSHWPAISTRPWSNPSYLLSLTLGGRRLVPVELGRSYTDDGWGQKIMPFSQFMAQHMSHKLLGSETTASTTGYLAQHDLFSQIPALRRDICVPDYCYSDPPSPAPVSQRTTAPGDGDDDDSSPPPPADPLLNAWFGPAHTVSPLHTDPHHNVLAQLVGHKYVRLYAPAESARLYPRFSAAAGVDMSNTSRVELGEAMCAWEGWAAWDGAGGEDRDQEVEEEGPPADGGDQTARASSSSSSSSSSSRRKLESRFPAFRDARYVEGVLAPGECLYIPRGWWHYVRSLSPSFSVSFWWD